MNARIPIKIDKGEKKQVLEILDYWKTIEFLGQDDLPKVTMNKTEGNVSKAESQLFVKEISLVVDLQSQIESGKSKAYPECSEEVGFIFGKVLRNDYATYIEKKFMKEELERPELPYPKTSAFGWFSFSTDTKGVYQKSTFQLSSLLWALSIWEKNKADKNFDFHIDTSEYDDIIKKIDEELEEKNIDEFLPKLYWDIKRGYVDPAFPESQLEERGICVYKRYTNEGAKNQDEEGEGLNLADLGKSFFLKDIMLLYDKIVDETFGHASEYEKKVIDYILSAYRKSNEQTPKKRTIISPKEDPDFMRNFFDETLNIQKAPMGKWPAKFMPALMQQVAVNLAIQQGNEEIPVFSVNGPPGTGKTTLLKEIVANNVVERAKLLAKYSNPDEAFEMQSFSEGPLDDQHENSHPYYKFAPHYYALKDDHINRYGMLVASCNNAAVENITVDLPKAKDIIDGLTPGDEPKDVKIGLQEICNLFDIEKSTDIETVKKYKKEYQVKDIYFTRYANKLLSGTDCWGLVSAPFGKKSNIRNYCDLVLKPFVDEYKYKESRDEHKKKFEEIVKRFKEQVLVVENLANEIYNLIDCSHGASLFSTEELTARKGEIELAKKQLDDELFDKQKKLMELEETSWIRRMFESSKSSSTRKELITGLNSQVRSLKQKKQEQEEIYDKILKCEKFNQLKSEYSKGENELAVIDQLFMAAYRSNDDETSTKAQVTNPWFTPKYNREREKLFLYACKLHKEFCLSSKGVMHNIQNLLIAWNMHSDCGERMKQFDREAAMPSLLQTIFLLTPVISTTFASAQTFLKDIKKSGSLGTLIVDEAGQAQPQMAIGAMFRCRKAIIVGDPKQIEPVVTAEVDIIKQMMSSELLSAYKDKKLSVQGFADFINPYGTFLGEDEEKEWVGCPLVVHRRCIEPMFSISNHLSYDGTMKQKTANPKKDKSDTFILEKSAWIQVSGAEKGDKDHFVEAQGKIVLKLLERKLRNSADKISLYIITPFTSVKYGMLDMLNKSELCNEERIKQWLKDDNIGTVHTFQGKGTDEVIFLLGCDNSSVSAANWVNKNIVNVAATRAKYRFYIIGDKDVWSNSSIKIARDQINNEITKDELDKMLVNLENGKRTIDENHLKNGGDRMI